jgi:hypothetical protein
MCEKIQCDALTLSLGDALLEVRGLTLTNDLPDVLPLSLNLPNPLLESLLVNRELILADLLE